ncbi:MAG: glutaredoxin domain-containing protein [Candidatus Aminicenantaceae bacterium]
MKYLLFTYPNCERCGKIKAYLNDHSFDWEEYNLVNKESKMKIRNYLRDVKRDKDGAIIIPVLIIQENNSVKSVVNSVEELETWLKSKE